MIKMGVESEANRTVQLLAEKVFPISKPLSSNVYILKFLQKQHIAVDMIFVKSFTPAHIPKYDNLPEKVCRYQHF